MTGAYEEAAYITFYHIRSFLQSVKLIMRYSKQTEYRYKTFITQVFRTKYTPSTKLSPQIAQTYKSSPFITARNDVIEYSREGQLSILFLASMTKKTDDISDKNKLYIACWPVCTESATVRACSLDYMQIMQTRST